MNIAFIRKRFDPYGGAENYLNSLVKILEQKKHNIYIISTNWSNVPGVNLIRVKPSPSFDKNAKYAVKSLQPHCTVSFERTTCQDIYRAGDGCHRSWLELRGRFIDGPLKRLSFKLNPKHWGILKKEGKIFKNTPIIVVNSEMVKKQIISHYSIDDEKIKVIYNGVNTERFNKETRLLWRTRIRAGLAIDETRPLLLFLGSGFKRKGLKFFLHALRHTPKDVCALVAGKGAVAEYKGIARQLGVSGRVIFVGAVQNSEKYYAACDLFILPTVYDPFSNATLEALASGLPVITSRFNGVCEIIRPSVEGEIIDDLLDDRELGHKIMKSLNNLGSMSEAATAKAKEYTITKSAGRLIDTIDILQNIAIFK